MAIKTYEEVMGKTSTQKSGIITYESLFGKKEEPVPPKKQGLFSTPSNLSPERQAAYDRGFFPKPINNLLANLTQRYEDSKLGKFQARSSETALDVMSAQEINPDRTSTGSKVGDTAATVLGSIGGFVMSPNKGASIGSALTKVGQPAEFAARKLLTKAPAVLPKIATKAAPVIARGATEGAAYGFGTGIAQGKSTGGAVKQAGTDALFGVALDPLIVLGIPALGSKLRSGVQRAIDKYKGVKVDTDTIAKDVAKDIGVDWAYMNESQRAAIRRVVQNMQPEPVRSGRLLFPAQEFTMRDMTPQDKMLSVMGGKKPLALPEGRGTKNTFIDNKYNEQYNNIEDIKKQLAKYYSGFKDGGIDDAAKAISDLEETERRITGDYLQNNPAEAPNGLRGHPNRIQNKPYKTVGLSFSRELIDTGKVNLTGFKFNDVKELATVAQVFRDPRFETFRIIYTNGNEVVGTDALTSRLPGSATAFLGDIKRYLQKNIERMKRIGADGYYLLHNHPSGKNVKPSQDDVNLTYTYAKNLPGFRGHVIINSNKYTEIYTDTTLGDIRLAGRENLPLDLGEDLLLTPSITHDLIGKQISSSSQLASAAKTLQTDNDISTVVFTNSAGEVTGIQEVSNSMIRNSNNNNFRNFLRRQAMEHGGRNAFIVGDQSVAKELQSLVESDDLTDAIIKNTGRNLRTDDFVRGDTWMGLDVIKQGRRAPLPKPFKNQPLQFKTQIPRPIIDKTPIPPMGFKQTIEVPKVYDKHVFIGETRPLSKLDQLMMKENAGTNQVMAKIEVSYGDSLAQPDRRVQVSKIDQPAKIETVEEILRTIMPGKLKDISGPQSYFTDVYRNFRKVFGKDYGRIKKALLDPFDKAKGENARFQESWLNKLQTEIVSDKTGLGIKKGSKLSALVQKYGEGTITEAELSSLTEAELNKIKTADAWFRKAYDELLDRVNLVRRQIYPTNPDKIIPKRQDYYRHFKEITNDIQGLKNIFDTPAQIDPKLEGISEYTKPKTAWKSWAQRRFGGMDYTNDAVGGFLEYLPSASYGIHIDPHISKFSGLAKQLAEKTGATKETNNFIRFLNQYSQDLAGKTNPLDRRIQEMVGRGPFRLASWLNSRVKANVILGNLGSSLAQLGNIPQGIAHAKQHSLNGFLRTIRSLYEPNKAIAQSDFIKERFLDKLYRQFDTDLLSKPRNLAVWLMESMDKVGTHFIWNSAHEKAIKEGIKNPIKYADDVTRDMVAGRGIGEVPIGQKSKMMQTLIPFTLEVSNLWKVQKDMLNKKDMVGLLLLYASCFGFNEAMEKIRGSRVTFDPIDALREAIADDELTGFRRAGRLVGEVISNVPGGQFAAQLYPEYGAQIGETKLPSRKELFGSNDPTRYGPGLISVKGIQDPLTYLALPFGGMQISKTLKGVDALRNRGVYTEKPTLLTYGQELLTGEPQPRTKLKYPVDTDLKNIAGGLMFGIGGLKETRPYYDNNRRPLSENQTKDLKRQEAKGRNVKALYEVKMAERRIDTLETKLKEVKLERDRLRQEIKKYKELRNQFLQKK